MFDKEDIYDAEIAPLVATLIQVCKENDIPMVASFCYAASDDGESTDLCTTFIPQQDGWAPAAFKDCKARLFKTPSFVALTISKATD